MYTGRVIADALNIRTGPGINYPLAGSAQPYGTLLEADIISPNYWWHITNLGIDGWMSSGNGVYIEDTTPVEPPPPGSVIWPDKLVARAVVDNVTEEREYVPKSN